MNEGEASANGAEHRVLRFNNDDFILKTCELWADKLLAAGKQYYRVVLITEDSGMLAKAKHNGNKVLAVRVRELPTTHDRLKELMLDKGLLESLPNANHQVKAPEAYENGGNILAAPVLLAQKRFLHVLPKTYAIVDLSLCKTAHLCI